MEETVSNKKFILNYLSVGLVESALDQLHKIGAPENIIDLIILYSWCFVACTSDADQEELICKSLQALEEVGWEF